MKKYETTIDVPVSFFVDRYDKDDAGAGKTKFEIGAATKTKSGTLKAPVICGLIGKKKMRQVIEAMYNLTKADFKTWCVVEDCLIKKDIEIRIGRVLDKGDVKDFPDMEYWIELSDKYENYLRIDMSKQKFNDVLNVCRKAFGEIPIEDVCLV